MTKKQKILGIVIGVVGLIFGAGLLFQKTDKLSVISESVAIMNNVIRFLPIDNDIKKEMEVIDKLTQELTKQDDIERRYLILLQNNMELRPGGGFLGQYAVVRIKNGQVIKHYFEDANLLDQRIKAKVRPPYPFKRMMSIKKWKFRDSNFSPDFPINADKAKYFYRLAGGNNNFDGVIAVNSNTFNNIFKVTGPITMAGYGEFNSENATMKLEEIVEKKYILAEGEIDTQNRKAIMIKMTEVLINKLSGLNNVPSLAKFALEELRNKDVMLNFENEELQRRIEEAHWAGKVSRDWSGDYLMIVGANMGALKTDHYMKREISYSVDLTGEKPTAELSILYKNTATYGDWRTSDYHSYLRVYVPKGSTLVERKMVSYPLIDEEFNKTYFGFLLHVLIARQTPVVIKYELPERFKNEDYKLLVQKQSGVGDVPIKIHLKTKDGEFNQEAILKKDLKFNFK